MCTHLRAIATINFFSTRTYNDTEKKELNIQDDNHDLVENTKKIKLFMLELFFIMIREKIVLFNT